MYASSKMLRTIMRLLLTGVGLLVLTAPAYAEKTKHTFYYVGGLSTGLQTGPQRLGFYDWELGVLGAGSNGMQLGVSKLFYAGENAYTGFGLVVMGMNVFGQQAPGLYGSLGADFEWLPFLFFRAELYMTVLADGATEGGPLIGLVVGW